MRSFRELFDACCTLEWEVTCHLANNRGMEIEFWGRRVSWRVNQVHRVSTRSSGGSVSSRDGELLGDLLQLQALDCSL